MSTMLPLATSLIDESKCGEMFQRCPLSVTTVTGLQAARHNRGCVIYLNQSFAPMPIELPGKTFLISLIEYGDNGEEKCTCL